MLNDGRSETTDGKTEGCGGLIGPLEARVSVKWRGLDGSCVGVFRSDFAGAQMPRLEGRLFDNICGLDRTTDSLRKRMFWAMEPCFALGQPITDGAPFIHGIDDTWKHTLWRRWSSGCASGWNDWVRDPPAGLRLGGSLVLPVAKTA